MAELIRSSTIAKHTRISYAFGSDASNFPRVDSAIHPPSMADEPPGPICRWEGCVHKKHEQLPLCLPHAIYTSSVVRETLNVLTDISAAQPQPEPVPFVYYLMIGPSTVKIGTTIQLRQRLNQLRTDAQYVVALEIGGLELERERHLKFAEERYGRREDFALSDRLKRHIESLQPKRDELVKLAMSGRVYEDELSA